MKAETLLEMMNNTAPPPAVIEGVLPERSVVLISGLGHTSKTFLALEACLAVARGEPWLGKFPTVQGTALYVGEDSPKHDVTRQMRKLLRGHKVGGEELVELAPDLLFTVNEGATLSHEKGVARIAELVLKVEPALLVLDSLRQLTRGVDENDSTELSKALGGVRDLADTGPGVLLIHHNSRAGNARGTTAIFDTVDGHLNLRPNKRKDWVEATVEKRRCIEATDFAYFHLWDHEEARLEFVDEVERPNGEVALLLALLGERKWIRTGDASTALVSNVRGITPKAAESRASRHLQLLLSQKRVSRPGRGIWCLPGHEKAAVSAAAAAPSGT